MSSCKYASRQSSYINSKYLHMFKFTREGTEFFMQLLLSAKLFFPIEIPWLESKTLCRQ